MKAKFFAAILFLFLLSPVTLIPASSQEESDSLQLLVGTSNGYQNSRGEWVGNGSLILYDIFSAESEVVAENENYPIVCPAFSSDGRFIAYALANPWTDILNPGLVFGAQLIDLEGENEGAIFGKGSYSSVPCPQWSPTTSQLLFFNAPFENDEPHTGILNAGNLNIGIISTEKANISNRSWSPDGHRIGFPIIPLEGFTDIVYVYTLNMEERSHEQKGFLHASRLYDWSADSSHAVIGFYNQQGMLRLYAALIETGVWNSPDDLMETSLTQTTNVEDARWSPNSPWIAFWQASEDYDISELYVFDSENQVLRLVTNQMFVDPDPNKLFEWSPGGRYLVYRDTTDYKVRVYDVENDESRILENAADFPRWSPDGTHLLFAKSTENTGFRKLGEWALYNVAEDKVEHEFKYQDENGRIFYGNILWHPDGRYVLVAHGKVLLDLMTGSVFRTGTGGDFLAWRPSPKNN